MRDGGSEGTEGLEGSLVTSLCARAYREERTTLRTLRSSVPPALTCDNAQLLVRRVASNPP